MHVADMLPYALHIEYFPDMFQQYPPMKISKIPLSPLFFSPLDFEKLDFVEFENTAAPPSLLHKRGGATNSLE